MKVLIFCLPLPAVANFTLNELGIIHNKNIYRLITGFLLGVSISELILLFQGGQFILPSMYIIWLFALEILVALILRKYKLLDGFINEYEDGLFMESEITQL